LKEASQGAVNERVFRLRARFVGGCNGLTWNTERKVMDDWTVMTFGA